MQIHVRLKRLEGVHHTRRDPTVLVREVGSRILHLADDADRSQANSERQQSPKGNSVIILVEPWPKLIRERFVASALAGVEDEPVRRAQRVVKAKGPIFFLIAL